MSTAGPCLRTCLDLRRMGYPSRCSSGEPTWLWKITMWIWTSTESAIFSIEMWNWQGTNNIWKETSEVAISPLETNPVLKPRIDYNREAGKKTFLEGKKTLPQATRKRKQNKMKWESTGKPQRRKEHLKTAGQKSCSTTKAQGPRQRSSPQGGELLSKTRKVLPDGTAESIHSREKCQIRLHGVDQLSLVASSFSVQGLTPVWTFETPHSNCYLNGLPSRYQHCHNLGYPPVWDTPIINTETWLRNNNYLITINPKFPVPGSVSRTLAFLWGASLYTLYHIYHILLYSKLVHRRFKLCLVGGWATPLKNDGLRQLGWFDDSQYFWENKIDGNQTTNQYIYIYHLF